MPTARKHIKPVCNSHTQYTYITNKELTNKQQFHFNRPTKLLMFIQCCSMAPLCLHTITQYTKFLNNIKCCSREIKKKNNEKEFEELIEVIFNFSQLLLKTTIKTRITIT